MREITSHKGDRINDEVCIQANGRTPVEGAPSLYVIGVGIQAIRLPFAFGDHHGPTALGVTESALLAIVADRLQCRFDAVPSDELGVAIHSTATALEMLQGLAKEASRT